MMNGSVWNKVTVGWLVGMIWLAVTANVEAQKRGAGAPQPHIGYVFPAGGQQGTTFEVTVGGEFLRGVRAVFVSGDGVTAEVVKYHRPMNNGQVGKLRDKLNRVRQQVQKELRDRLKNETNSLTFDLLYKTVLKYAEKEGLTEQQLQDVAEARFLRSDPKRQLNPQLIETVVLRVTIQPDASPGPRDLRLVTATAVSNPLRFEVGEWPEICEPTPSFDEPRVWLSVLLGRRLSATKLLQNAGRKTQFGRGRARRNFTGTFRRRGQNNTSFADEATPVKTLPCVLNGRILPGETDRFVFQGKQGQKLVVAVEARRLVPYLADAVPGWFQAVVALRDAQGNELAFCDDFRFNPDPVLFYELPRDGRYVLEIRDALYRGREDFVYRISLGELPWITGLFPLGAPAGSQTEVQLFGWNLPQDRLTLTTLERDSNRRWLWVEGPNGRSNLVPFAVGQLPETVEHEPNDSLEQAEPVSLPVVVNGRIEQSGDQDVFRFEGQAGQTVVVEVTARRLNSPVDSLVALLDASGHVLAENDDHEDPSAGLITHQADSWLSLRLPKDGTYYVSLLDTQHHGGPQYAYRLRISRPRPDFALRVVPSSLSTRVGVPVPVTVYVLRKDGFDGEIHLRPTRSNGPGPTYRIDAPVIPSGVNRIRTTLTLLSSSFQKTTELKLEGVAKIHGRQIRRPAVPADDLMQAFIYHHLVPAQELLVRVLPGGTRRRPGMRLRWQPSSARLQVPVNGSTTVKLPLPQAGFGVRLLKQLHVQLEDPPAGLSLANVQVNTDGISLSVKASSKAKAGLKDNLIFGLYITRKVKRRGRERTLKFRVGSLPALPIELVEEKNRKSSPPKNFPSTKASFPPHAPQKPKH